MRWGARADRGGTPGERCGSEVQQPRRPAPAGSVPEGPLSDPYDHHWPLPYGATGPDGAGVIHAARRTDTSPSLCAPVSAAVDGASGYTPVGSVQRIAGGKDHSAILTLVSYHSADAARVINELRTALKSCKGYTAGPMKATYEDVEATDDAPQGDDGVAFRLRLTMEPGEGGLKLPVSAIAVRHGSTLAIYKAVSDTPGTSASVPSDLLDARSKVLDAAVTPLRRRAPSKSVGGEPREMPLTPSPA